MLSPETVHLSNLTLTEDSCLILAIESLIDKAMETGPQKWISDQSSTPSFIGLKPSAFSKSRACKVCAATLT